MKQLIGQNRLVNFISCKTLDTFPRTLLLIGDYGAGKHMLCDYIASKFGLQIENISDKLTLSTIEEINSRVNLFLYIIESNKISIKEENTILKLLEEPPKSAYIVILCENPAYLLNTVRNRCYVMRMDKYSSDELKLFLADESATDLLNIAKTPGQLKELVQHPIMDMQNLANKMFSSIGTANFANMLTITDKLAFKQEKDRFDYKIFFQILLYTITTLVVEGNVDRRFYAAYQLTNTLYNQQSIAHIDCKMLFETYLCKLRKCMRGESYDN